MFQQLQRVAGIAGELLDHRVIEPNVPVKRRIWLIPLNARKVVHHVAAAEDHHSPFAQGREARAQFQMVVDRLQSIDRELDHGHVGLGKEVSQYAPGPMIEPPLVAVQADPERLGDIGHFLRQLGRARGRILESKQFVGEAVEI